jgi:hypothetical protein
MRTPKKQKSYAAIPNFSNARQNALPSILSAIRMIMFSLFGNPDGHSKILSTHSRGTILNRGGEPKDAIGDADLPKILRK